MSAAPPGRPPVLMHAVIAAAKAAVKGLVRALAADLAPRVRVNAIAPSLTETSLAGPLLSSPAVAESLARLHPISRLGQAAAVASFLLGPRAGWITGQLSGVDGGRSSVQQTSAKVASLRAILAILPAAVGLAAPAGALAAPFDPLAVYGPAHRFQVLREGAPAGFHELRIAPDGVGGWTVHSQLDLRVRLLGFTVYRLDYRSRAAWNAGGVQDLAVTVAENDRRREITMRRDGDGLAIDGPAGTFRTSAPLFPTDHWHPGVLSESRVLNTLTGRIAAVTITPGAWKPLATASGTIEVRPYVYSGEVETEVWYDRRGRWVAMRFRGTDGSEIRYVCETCGCDVCNAPPAPAAVR